VVLRGNGPSFCSGGDLAEFGTTPDVVTAMTVRIRQSAGPRIARLGTSVTARLHGACIGAGVELPAFASTVVADRGTRFQLPEIAMGLIPGAGGTVSIPRRIGRWRTAWLALTGHRIDAATAHAWGSSMNSPEDCDEAGLWALSGAMAITGLRDGAPLVSTGRPATAVVRALDQVADRTEARTGCRPALPGMTVLGERAALTGFGRNGPRSVGGPYRILHTADGHLGVSLPRAGDLESVPAIIGAATPGDPWDLLTAWARTTSTTEAVDRCRTFDLAAAGIPAALGRPDSGAPCRCGSLRVLPVRAAPSARELSTCPRSGPAPCARTCSGSVAPRWSRWKSTRRPDGARSGNRDFYNLLHHGHAAAAFDFGDPDEIDRLQALIASADLVIEASRPQALERLGIFAAEHVAAGVIWLSITARGRASNTVGFGDDVAGDAGLLAWDGARPVAAADAIANPMTGVTAAAAADALLSDRSAMIEVSMFDVAAAAAAARAPEEHRVISRDGEWAVETATGLHPVRAPVGRRASGPAASSGADNARYGG
jgi:hypothetical protein